MELARSAGESVIAQRQWPPCHVFRVSGHLNHDHVMEIIRWPGMGGVLARGRDSSSIYNRRFDAALILVQRRVRVTTVASG